MVVYYKKILNSLGTVGVYANQKHLLAIFLSADSLSDFKKKFNDVEVLEQSCAPIDTFEKELSEYLSGKRKNFTVSYEMHGTSFQQKAWQQLLQIPYGETISYLDQAKQLGGETLTRAVGGANSKNLLPILIPCHRVITSDGKLGGYLGGFAMKEKLLQIEKTYL